MNNRRCDLFKFYHKSGGKTFGRFKERAARGRQPKGLPPGQLKNFEKNTILQVCSAE
jgi:hypothetical protein